MALVFCLVHHSFLVTVTASKHTPPVVTWLEICVKTLHFLPKQHTCSPGKSRKRRASLLRLLRLC